MTRAALVGVACLLAFAGRAAATGSTPATVASFYVGHPVEIETFSKRANMLYGYTFIGGHTIWLRADLARELSGKRDQDFAIALQVLLHESFHLRWAEYREGYVEMAANLVVPDALERFFGVPIGSRESRRIWNWALNFSRAAHPTLQLDLFNAPLAYHPLGEKK